jgi:hypothetical protein
MHEQVRYPHILAQDAPILTAYLKEHGARYHAVDFDVRVGTGRDPGKDYDDNIRHMALDISRRRIDALGHKPGSVDVIEVTDAAGTTSLGQLLVYKRLYDIEHNPEQPATCIIAARSIQTDMLSAYQAAGIEIHLYPDA